MTQQEKLARARGVEEGLATALGILSNLAEVMLEREQNAKPGKKANYARRTRIKAYQVAAKRVQTRLTRQGGELSKLETADDRLRDEQAIKAEVANLAL